jgi:hypothetical protein
MKQKTLKDLRERYAVEFFLGFGVFISQILATNFSFLPHLRVSTEKKRELQTRKRERE